MEFTEEERNKWIEWSINSNAFLNNKILVQKRYPITEDHDHCIFCWVKFSNHEGDLKEGYYVKDANCWICNECYDIFKDSFLWDIERQ